jgi:hypothetical protein
LRLDIPVDDIVLMGVGQPAGYLDSHTQDVFVVKITLAADKVF